MTQRVEEVVIAQDNTADLSRGRRTLQWIGIIVGIGIAGTLDEVVLHQLLQWHNFYVHTTPSGRIVSDGLFHLFSTSMLVLGIWLLWSRRQLLSTQREGRTLLGAVLIGLGGFNLYDGTIQHHVLHLHPVREGVTNTLPYDLAFNGIALLLLIVGIFVSRSSRHLR